MKLALATLSLVASTSAFTTSVPRAFNSVATVAPKVAIANT